MVSIYLFIYLIFPFGFPVFLSVVQLNLRESAMFGLQDFQHQMEICCAKIQELNEVDCG